MQINETNTFTYLLGEQIYLASRMAKRWIFFHPRTIPKTFLQRFALRQREYKPKHCRSVLGRKKLDAKSVLKWILKNKTKKQVEWEICFKEFK